MAVYDLVHVCPFCLKRQDALSNPKGEVAEPHPDAAGICFACGNVFIFDEEMKPRKPTSEEAEELAADERIQSFLRMRAEGKTLREMT